MTRFRRPVRILFALPLALAVMLAALAAGPLQAQETTENVPFSDMEKQALEALVRDYILENPEIILESVQRLEARRQLEAEEAQRRALSERTDELYGDPMAPAHGPEADAAAVTFVEFFDYQCSYCKRVLPSVMQVLERHDDVRVVFKELPILGPMSTIAAKGALAAKRQGKYLAYHREVMGLRGGLTEERLYETAAAIGLDVEQLKADMRDPEIDAYLRKNQALAQEIGITGTPALIIGGELVPGAIPLAEMERRIAAARENPDG